MKKRRHFSAEFKAQLALDILAGIQSQAEACRKHNLSPNLVASWKALFLERDHLTFGATPPAAPSRLASPSRNRSWAA